MAIDDPRFFGNIVPDQDYPELEDAAFSQNMLSNYASLRAARGRTIASQHDTTQQEEFDFRNMADFPANRHSQSPDSSTHPSPSLSRGGSGLVSVGHIPGEDSWKPDDSGSRSRGRMSDIEVMREERARASLSVLGRSSMSSAGAGMAMRFDDDIPAFDDQMDDMAFGGDEPPQLDYYDEMAMNTDAEFPDMGQDAEVSRGRRGAVEEDDGPQEEFKSGRESGRGQSDEEDADAAEHQKPRRAAAGAARGKRQRVTVDGSVELSGKVIKQRMADVNSILRRRPGDLLPRYAGVAVAGFTANRPNVPLSVQGLCPELQALFAMTMLPSHTRLPFPLKPGATGLAIGADRKTGATKSRDSVSLDVEAVRENDASLHDLNSRRWSSTSLVDEGEDFGAGLAEQRMSMLDVPQDHDFGGGGDMFDYDREGEFAPDVDMGDEPQAFRAVVNDYSHEDAGSGGALLGWKGKPTAETGDDEGGDNRLADWSARTAMVFDVLQDQLKEEDSVSFKAISKGISRRTAAACFLEILQLKTWGFVDVAQESPFADIDISPTTKFWDKGAQVVKA